MHVMCVGEAACVCAVWVSDLSGNRNLAELHSLADKEVSR